MNKSIKMDQSKAVILLATCLVMTVTWAVGATGWTEGLGIVAFVGLGSILISLMLVRSILPAVIAHLFSIVIGVSWSFWVTARLLPPSYTWLERWENLALRLNHWYNQAIQGGTSYDNLMFILQMGVIVWGMGYLTIWFLFRSGKVWQAIVPGGLVLLINLYYAPNDITMWFLIYVLLSLLLAIRFNLFKQEAVWRAEGVFFRPDISFDFLRDGFIFSALVIVLAWLAPPVVDAKSLGLLDEFQGSWREVQGEWNRLYADLNYRDTRSVDAFGQSLTLGGPRRLTDEPVMNVRVEGTGRYWRAAVYDEYNGSGWYSNDGETAHFGPDTQLSLPIFGARTLVTQTYTFYRDGATVLYAMSQPVGLDRSARVSFNALSTEQIAQVNLPDWPDYGEPWVEEVTYIRSNAAINTGESYQIVSAVSQATVNQLEVAGNDYPEWVTARYLQLPEAITERTRALARQLSEPYENAFAKTRAIESYLRTEIKYNEKLATPPPDVDKVDYILFEVKEAYCDYYASAMIVMLRSLGIPARFAVGFARGTFDSELNAFHVVNADAHSWVEVYFPNYGWIEFEPTAAQPNIIRPATSEGSAAPPASSFPNPDDFPGREEFPGQRESLLSGDADIGAAFIWDIPWMGGQISLSRSAINGGVIVIGGAFLSVLVVGSLWWRQQQVHALDNIFRLYQRMLQLAGWMGITVHPWQTPYEHAAILQRSLPSRQREVDTITAEYVYQTFSPPLSLPPTRADEQAGLEPRRSLVVRITGESILAWQRLQPTMLKAILKRRLPKWLRR